VSGLTCGCFIVTGVVVSHFHLQSMALLFDSRVHVTLVETWNLFAVQSKTSFNLPSVAPCSVLQAGMNDITVVHVIATSLFMRWHLRCIIGSMEYKMSRT
jgi:hypothetical protein